MKGDAEFAGNSLLHLKDGSAATIDGSLSINHNTKSYGENVVGTNSSLTVNGNLNVNAVYSNDSSDEDPHSYTPGKLFASGEGSAITVKGNTTVRDNAQLFAQTYSIGAPGDNESKTKDEFKNVAKAIFEGDVDVSNNAGLASFAAADVTVQGDLNASTGALIETRASGATLTVKGNGSITGDGTTIQVGNTGNDYIEGNLTLEDKALANIYDNSTLNVGGDFYATDASVKVNNNSSLNVGGALNAEGTQINGNKSTLSVGRDFTLDNKVEGSDSKLSYLEGTSVNVGGNLNMDGQYVAGPSNNLDNDEVWNAYYKNRFVVSRGGSSLDVKGDVNLNNNSHLKIESYWSDWGSDDTAEIPEFDKASTAHVAGNITVDNNSFFESSYSSELTVDGNVTAKNGAKFGSYFSNDKTTIVKGDAKATNANSVIEACNRANIDIGGNLEVTDGALANAWAQGHLKVAGNASFDSSELKSEKNSSVSVGKDLSLDKSHAYINDNGTLNVAGSLNVEASNIDGINGTINVGKDLNYNNDVAGSDSKGVYLEGSSVNVEGDLNMNGQYIASPRGDIDNEEDWEAYYKNRFSLSKGGSSLEVKGNVNLDNTSYAKVESYWGDWGEDATTEIPEFDKASVAHIAGNVKVDHNSNFESSHGGEITVDGDATATNGSQIGAWFGNAKTNIKGNVKVADANSELGTGNNAQIDIGGNLEVTDGAIANAWTQGKLTVQGNVSAIGATLKSEVDSLFTVGTDLSLTNSQLTLADNGVLNVAGNLNGKGAYIDEKNTALSVGKNVKLDGSSVQVKDSTFAVNGNYEGVNTALNANGKTAVRVDKDLTVSGKNELITGAFDGASLKVGGTANVSDLVRFTADRDASIEIGNNLNLNSTLSDASDASRESAGIYNKSSMKVCGDVNVESDSLLKADFDSSIEIGGDLNVKVDSHRNEIVGAYNNSSIKVKGNLKADRSSSYKENADINSGISSTIDVNGNAKLTGNSKFNIFDKSKVNVGGDLEVSRDAGNDVWTNLSDNSSLNVEGNFTSDKSSLSAYENSSVNVSKNLTLTNTVDENHEIYLENSSLNVNGDVTLKGLYKDHAYSTDEDTAGTYYRNKIFTSGVDASYKIGGDLNLVDNSNFGLETASNVPGDDPSDTIIKDNFDKVATGLVAGNVNVKNNSRFGVYQSAEATVNGDITATNGGIVSAYNSGAALTVKGDVNVSDKLSRLETGNIGSIDVAGKVAVENGATAYIGKKGTISASKGFSVNNATLEIENGKLVLSGEDAVLDLTQGGVLKTDEAGSIALSKGASVESLKETLLSDDTKTTAAGVAEKTFEADALSKVHLTNLGEVSLDEAQRLHGVLFNSETGILDLKINLDTDENGNVGFEDAVKVAGTTAAEYKTITDVDTSDKKLSDLTSSDLSWGSASLKEGQTDLDLGSGNLALNNPESNNGSFVSTADGTTGNITMDKDANLALNGNGAIGDVNTTENGTGDILIGNDKAGTVTANNLGSDDKAFGSVSVGSGSSVTVKNILNAAKVALEKKAEVIASVIKSPELKAIGDDIKIKAEKSVLGGLLSGNNSLLDSNSLELADNFNVLGGAKVKAKNLSLKGKMLFADPDWNSNASVVVANNLSGDNGDVLDGALVAGQNSLVAIDDTLDENSAAVLAKSTLSENGTTALGYVGKDITVAANGSITIDGSLTSAPANVEDNTVTVASNSALVLANNSKVSFESADGKVTNNGAVIVSSDTLANNSKITAFEGDNVTVSGNGSFDVSSALFKANSNGDGTLTVNYDENKADNALYGTEANVAQSIKTALISGVAVNKGTILGDLVNAGNSSTTASTLSQLTRLGTLAGSVANAKLASDTTANAIDSRLASSGVKTNTQATAQSNKLTVWVQPVFSRQSSSSLDAGNTEYGIKTNLRGGVAGLDVTLSDNFVQGAAITVGSGNSSSKNIKSVSGDFDYYGFNLYGAYVNDEIKLSYDLGYTKVSNDATAYNSLGKFTSDIDTKVFTLGIKGAYTFNTSVMDITPHLGVRYAKYDSDDYTASSGIYSVNNEGASSSLVSFPVGVSFSKDITLSSWTVVPTVNLEVIPVTGDKDVDTRSAFDGVVTSVNTKLHDGINYSTFVGLDALYGENFSLGINYNYTGSKNVDDHSVNASLRYTF